MKKLSIAFILVCATFLRATDFPSGTIYNTVDFSSSISITNLASLGSISITNNIEFANYHSFQFVFNSTNNGNVVLYRSLDLTNPTNWVSVSTNSFTTNNSAAFVSVGEQTMTGKWAWSKVTFNGTNATATVNYIGGR